MQIRECLQGHIWTICRRHKSGNNNSMMSWTDGSLMCPTCDGYAVKSYNYQKGTIATLDEEEIEANPS